MLQAASQVANTLTHLKSKYIKYLETLCNANGIDISTLKNVGGQYTLLEIYFGGFPVLIGLKYFENLTTLRIFSQHISCVKPLAEVANTLEELWLCEGSIKDLSGIEHCCKLKRVYLYENQIEDASPLAALTSLETLHLEGNRLRSLEFLQHLQQVVDLNLAGNHLNDVVMSTICHWPQKMQHLDISGNSFRSYKALFTLGVCSSLRHLYLASPMLIKPHIRENESFLGWVAYCFRFIESLDEDDVADNFTSSYLPLTEARVADTLNAVLKIEEKLQKDIKLVDRHTVRVESKLGRLCEALEKMRDSLPGKDGKREVVKRVLEVAHTNVKAVKNTKKHYRQLARFDAAITRYRVAISLESSDVHPFREANEDELACLRLFLNNNCSMKHSYEVHIKSCTVVRHFSKADMDRLFIIDRSEQSRLYDTRSIVEMMDGHLNRDYRTDSVRTYKDVELMKKEAKEKTTLFFFPIVISKNSGKMAKGLAPPTIPANMDSPHETEDQPIVTSEDKAQWKDVRLATIVAVELRYAGHIHIDHLRYNDQFDASFEEQLKKLKEMSITLHLKDDKPKHAAEEVSEATLESLSRKVSKVKRLKDVLNPVGLQKRYSLSKGYGNCLTIRSPVEVILAYGGKSRTITDTTDYQLAITTLDFGGLKLTKLGGIEELENLENLSLRDNKLTSLKKLRTLSCLRYLDVSNNHVSKLEQLPHSLIEVNLSYNRLCTLHFCHSLQKLERLNVSRNHIKSLKGVEGANQLEIFCAAENQIKEKAEIDHLKGCQKLWFIDFTGNPVTAIDGYRNKIHLDLPYLLAHDRELVVSEERLMAHKRTGRGLTLELIEKCFPEWADISSLTLTDHKLEIIVLDRPSVQRLSHVTHMDLACNQLQQVRELAGLVSLKRLGLSGNCVRLMWIQTQGEGDVDTPFPSLEFLDLSGNQLTYSMLQRLGLSSLGSLKTLKLTSNLIAKFDSVLFDLPNLETVDMSDNQIKSIRRKNLTNLKSLNLDGNRLKELDGLAAPNLKSLSVVNNKISTCSGLKAVSEMRSLNSFDCSGNPVTERRVYVEYVRNQIPQLEILDGRPSSEHAGLPEVRSNRTIEPHLNITVSRRQSLLSTTSFPEYHQRPSIVQFNLEPTDFMPKSRRPSRLSPIPPQHLSDYHSASETAFGIGDQFALFGTKAIKHKKL